MMLLRRKDRLGKGFMTVPLVVRSEGAFALVTDTDRFEGLSFEEARGLARQAAAGATVFACSWLVEAWNEDGPYAVDCGAPAVADDRGFRCAAGHEHVSMQARHDEGWDYFEDDEIQGMKDGQFFPGVGVRDMAGRVVL